MQRGQLVRKGQAKAQSGLVSLSGPDCEVLRLAKLTTCSLRFWSDAEPVPRGGERVLGIEGGFKPLHRGGSVTSCVTLGHAGLAYS